MTETQEVRERTRRRRRHAPAILLGGLPVAIASTALAGAYFFVPASATFASDGVPRDDARIAAPSARPVPSIQASSDAGLASDLHPVTVKPRPPVVTPPPAPPAAAASSPAPVATAPAASSPSTQAPTVSFTAYCANPDAPATATSVSGLLAAANAERARLGIAPLAWASDLASAASSWSQQMAAKDAATSAVADALAHNPNRPGAENVGVVYRSPGMAESSAMRTLHTNWVYSPGHCGNLMNPAYSQFGAGAAVTPDGTTWYATENFR